MLAATLGRFDPQRLKRGPPPAASMATKYCEFEPTQHRNKRVALFVFLDEPNDPHPIAICDVCITKLKKMRPDAITMPRKEFEKQRTAARKAAMPAAQDKGKDQAEGEEPAAETEPQG